MQGGILLSQLRAVSVGQQVDYGTREIVGSPLPNARKESFGTRSGLKKDEIMIAANTMAMSAVVILLGLGAACNSCPGNVAPGWFKEFWKEDKSRLELSRPNINVHRH